MIVQVTAQFMTTDPHRTKLIFYVGEHEGNMHPAGYLSMSNEQADAFLQHGLPINLERAHFIGDGEDDGEAGGDLYLLHDKRGRRDHG